MVAVPNGSIDAALPIILDDAFECVCCCERQSLDVSERSYHHIQPFQSSRIGSKN